MLFDSEFEFVGKHATYCRSLKEEIGLFTTFREAYMISAIVGFLNGSKGILYWDSGNYFELIKK